MKHGFAKAYAKINLTLDVLSRREDGYHNLEMLMQSVSLHDTVSVRTGCGSGVSVLSNVRYIPNDGRNIAVKAANAFFNATGVSNDGVAVTIEKRIPSSAGLAGGSADGAAVLRLLDGLYKTGLTDKELCEIGLTVGADVPFCLMGGTSLAQGRGEILSPISPLTGCFVVISKPYRGASTKSVFSEIDETPLKTHPDTAAAISAIEAGNISLLAKKLYNVFEETVKKEVRDVEKIKENLLQNGAEGAVMSGSGSSVFGLFLKEDAARRAAEALRTRYKDTFVAVPVASGDVRSCAEI